MKNQSIVIIIGLGVLVASAIAYSTMGTKPDQSNMPMGTQGDMPAGMRMPDGSIMGSPEPTSDTAQGMDMGSMAGMDMVVVKSERDFLEGMLPHHQEAVDSAKELLARGGSTPEIKNLAKEIVVAQEKEIAMMKGWYQDWYGEAYVANPAAYTPMMRDLSKLSGVALDKVFLEDMIVHHEGAVMMAESVQPYIENQEITDLTKAIKETQTAEITLMKQLIASLN